MEYQKFQIRKKRGFNWEFEIHKGHHFFRSIKSPFLSRSFFVFDPNGDEIFNFSSKNIFSSTYEIYQGDQLLTEIIPKASFRKFGLVIRTQKYRYFIDGNPFKRKWIVTSGENEIAIIVRKKRARSGLLYEIAILENEDYDNLIISAVILEVLMRKRKAARGY